MDALDPQLGAQQQQQQQKQPDYADAYRYPQAHTPQSPYTLNPIRSVPASQQSSTLPSISQDPSLPYYGGKAEYAADDGQDVSDGLPANGLKGDGHEPQKRPRSCESCRSLKVRCERDPSATGPCKRCAKADRQCIFTEPNHKRKKKTDSKVAELEKKIDALTASLIAVRGTNATLDNDVSAMQDGSFHAQDSMLEEDRPSRKRRRSTFERGQDMSSPSAKQQAMAALSASIPPLESAFQNHQYADAIDRQILSSSTATEIFQHYRERMAPNFPAVVIPAHVSAGEVRRTKPVLFLAILSVASGHRHSNIQRTLTREIMQAYADRVVNKGEKSLELIQALQVSVTWHHPEDQTDTRGFQLIQMAAAMATAIKFSRENHCFAVELVGRQKKKPSDAALEVEKKRAWVSCYVLSGISSAGLRQQNPVQWNRFYEEAAKTLETAPEAVPSDKILCKWARVQRLADEGIALFFNDGTAKEITERLVELESRTHRYAVDVEATGSLTLKMWLQVNITSFTYYRLMLLAMDDAAGSANTPSAESKDSFLWRYGELVSVYAAKAGFSSVSQMQQALDVFLSVNQEDVDTLPSVFFSRMSYILLFLIFLHLRAIGPEKKSGPPVDVESFRVAEYLTRFIERLSGSKGAEGSAATQKYCMLLKMFKSWFERQKDGPRMAAPKRHGQSSNQLRAEPIDSEMDTPRQGYRKLSVQSDSNAENGPKPPRSPAMQSADDATSDAVKSTPLPQMGNTPLHLLSQVASNEPSATTATNQQAQQDAWYNQINPYASTGQVPYGGDAAGYYPPPQADYSTVNGYPMDVGLVMDPEMEQAMSSAFGSEGNMMGNFFNEFMGLGMGHAPNGLAYGTWYGGEQ